MRKLDELRGEIDAIDAELTELLRRRLDVSDQVAAVKRESGAVISDPRREREILAAVSRAAGADCSRELRTVYSTIFNVSKARQRLRLAGGSELEAEIDRASAECGGAFPELAMVACSGDEGSFAQQAVSRMFEVPTVVYFNGFEKVFEAVEKDICPYGVLPVENSSAGSVSAVYDLMQRHRFHIVRGVKLKVEHVLLAKPGTELKDIRTVTSHPHALAQCSGFLKRNPHIKAASEVNTAVAARRLAESKDHGQAVIASRQCAELYGLKTIAEGIADSVYNYTRFICISRKLEIYPKANKFSVMLSLPHRPGSLNEVISKFAAIGVNLTKLESRPVLGSAFEFRFIFEFDSTPGNPEVRALIAELNADPEIEHFTFLGAYEEL